MLFLKAVRRLHLVEAEDLCRRASGSIAFVCVGLQVAACRDVPAAAALSVVYRCAMSLTCLSLYQAV